MYMGAFTNDVPPMGVGGCEMLTLLNKISKLCSIKLLTRVEGVKKVQKYADIICESPHILRYSSR